MVGLLRLCRTSDFLCRCNVFMQHETAGLTWAGRIFMLMGNGRNSAGKAEGGTPVAYRRVIPMI